MTVLGFDTATPDVAVAVTSGAEVLVERSIPAPRGSRPRHATELLPEIEGAVGEAGGWGEVELIAAGIGPGSFTGLRIGVATARGLAHSLGIPLAGVGSLDALARGIGEEAAAAGRPRLAAIDAKRSELFAALYDERGSRLWGPLVAAPATLGVRLGSVPGAPLAAGDGALRFRTDLEGGGAEVLSERRPAHRLAARHVCRAAAEMRPSIPHEVTPIYLRPPDAEAWRERDRGQRHSG